MVTCLLGALALPVLAQEGTGTGRLFGYVTDKDKNPIEGAKITMEYLTAVRKLETTTDEKGKFTFLGLGKGTVRIKAEKQGFANAGNQTKVSGIKKNPLQYITMLTPVQQDPSLAVNLKAKDDFGKAIQLLDNRKFNEALTLFQSCRDAKPKEYKISIFIGNTLMEMRRYDEALKEFNGVMDQIVAQKQEMAGNKDVAKIYAGMGDIYMRQDKFAKAEEYFKKSMEIDKSDHALPYNVGEIMFVAGKTDDAIKYYEMAIAIKPEFAKAYKQAGYAYLNKGDTKKAVELLKKFVQLDPNSPEVGGIEEVIKSL